MQIESRKQKLKEAFQTEKVLGIGVVKEIIGTTSRMTVFRKLKELGYRSYQHWVLSTGLYAIAQAKRSFH